MAGGVPRSARTSPPSQRPQPLQQAERGIPIRQQIARLLKPPDRIHGQWTHFGVNLDFVPGDTLLQPGDEVVLIPPVSGG